MFMSASLLSPRSDLAIEKPYREIAGVPGQKAPQRQQNEKRYSAHINMTAESQNDDRLSKRMAALGIREEDIEESFVRSGGHGGQNVNKTSTCVMLVHRPSGVSVKCQSTRQQGLNRVLARRLLLDKIESLRRGLADAERRRIEKLRRQKRGRSRAAKQRMLADKTRRAQTKNLRRRTFED
jgi:protein subunit release factor B